MIELAAAITLASLARCELLSQNTVILFDRYIHVHDVVALPCSGVVEPNFGDEIIAALPQDASHVSLSREGVADLVHRRLAGLVVELGAERGDIVTFRRPTPMSESTAARQCFAASRDLAAGDIVDKADITPAPCAGRNTLSLSYDRRTSVLRANREIATGDYLGRLMPLALSKWDENSAMKLHLRIGPVTIERDVWTLEPDAGATAVFVRDADGVILAAPAGALKPAEPSK